jgi:flagellar biosynthesis protein FliQ
VIGSPQIGWWIAHVAFWVLLALAVRDGRWRVIGVVGTLWIAGYIATRQVESLSLFFMPYVAILDIALVFSVLRRDIRLT